MENVQKNKVVEILKKSLNFFTADHESCTRSSDNSISTGGSYRSTVHSDLAMGGFRFMF